MDQGTVLDSIMFKNSRFDGLGYREVLDLVIEELSFGDGSYTLKIGTDSQVFQRGTIFVTGLVLTCDGSDVLACRGMYAMSEHLMEMRDKILKETEITSDLIDEMYAYLGDVADDFELEIHADVGLTDLNETRFVVDDVLDAFSGYGCEVLVKPDAYVASGYANRYTKIGYYY